MIYDKIISKQKKNLKQFALLIDPDKHTTKSLTDTVKQANKAKADFIFIGGSLILNALENCIETLKAHTSIPLILFPGSLLQINDKADCILLLSLISGRNPEFLIGNQVVAAPVLKKTKLEILATGYILIESGITSSVEYMSNTKPIPHEKLDIAVATAIAGEMLGLKLIYLEAGSGAPKPVSEKMIAAVKQYINIPIIVGGGIRTKNDIIRACKAGADIIVIGTAFEQSMKNIIEFSSLIHNFK